ncbi:hypothetical protein ULMS_18460 [Patiriisocius marinistellae]|uniref:HTH LytTR-type domain-containing protein n=2 Tax=Patiriisocius marinistellae TaxID=2494560 RepID=A0A5J4FY95_9FLAO|nr:hypothetical protein ULMS_18460 [Patiriisocius marinistellae]
MFLPLYGFAGAIAYLIVLPLQKYIYNKNNSKWSLWSELLFLLGLLLFGLLLSRSIYLYVIVLGEDNPYSLVYYTWSIYIPTIVTIFPIIIIGRWAIGRYFEKKLEDKKIEIKGEGTYEGLRLFLNDVIAIKSDDNYIEVTFINNGTLKRQLIRNKLSKIEIDLPQLLRTHRSHLINPNHFQQFKMERGKLSVLLTSEILIPVSKTYVENTKSTFQ